jgi:hypothetical protein
METMPMINLGAAAFWIALAAVLIAGGWHKVRREQIRQETLLKLIEKTGGLDEAQVNVLFPPPPIPHHWPPAPHRSDPGAARRVLKGFGAIVLSVAAGLVVFFTVVTAFDAMPMRDGIIGFGVAGLIAAVGIGFFAAAKFATGQASLDGQ